MAEAVISDTTSILACGWWVVLCFMWMLHIPESAMLLLILSLECPERVYWRHSSNSFLPFCSWPPILLSLIFNHSQYLLNKWNCQRRVHPHCGSSSIMFQLMVYKQQLNVHSFHCSTQQTGEISLLHVLDGIAWTENMKQPPHLAVVKSWQSVVSSQWNFLDTDNPNLPSILAVIMVEILTSHPYSRGEKIFLGKENQLPPPKCTTYPFSVASHAHDTLRMLCAVSWTAGFLFVILVWFHVLLQIGSQNPENQVFRERNSVSLYLWSLVLSAPSVLIELVCG